MDGASSQLYNTDEIRSAILYKPAVVTPVGDVMLSPNPVFNRPPVAQNFKLNATNKSFVFIVNHFKSKGCSSSSSVEDKDQGDGQGCYNATRREQAAELVNFFNSIIIPAAGHDPILSVGDYNAYFEEDPLDVLRSNGYQVLGSSSGRSYLFQGQVGSLDHAVVSASIGGDITSLAKWNINSPEPVYLDYNDGVKDAGEGNSDVNPWAFSYSVDPFRSSDHDPVLIGLNLTEEDKDGDGNADSGDNCPSIANEDQLDTDHDSIEDVCDGDDDNDGSPDLHDCKPLDASVHPNAVELCNGVDDNCDGQVDEGCSGSPLMTISNAIVYEAEGVARLTVRLSKTSAQTLKVSFETKDGSAVSKKTRIADKDFTATTGVLSIRPGLISETITIPITNDGTTEGEETFQVLLSKPSNTTINSGTAQVIIKDGVPSQLSGIEQGVNYVPSATEGKLSIKILTNPSSLSFTIQTSNESNQPVHVTVTDMMGRWIESFWGLPANGDIKLGAHYKAGIYYIKFVQGKQAVVTKLMKVK